MLHSPEELDFTKAVHKMVLETEMELSKMPDREVQ